jgi:hypothetical protein
MRDAIIKETTKPVGACIARPHCPADLVVSCLNIYSLNSPFLVEKSLYKWYNVIKETEM